MVIATREAVSDIDYGLDRPDGPKVELTREQKAQIWAGKKLGTFLELPNNTSTERHRANTFIETTANEILTDPTKLNVIDQVWGTEGELHGRVMAEIQSRMICKELLPHRTLNELVKLYASEEKAAPIAQELLKSYLNREGNIKSTVDTLYDFLFASLDLVGDQIPFEKAVLISNFEDPILSRQSEAYAKFIVARTVVDNDDLLTKAWIVDNVSFAAIYVTSINPQQVLDNNEHALSGRQVEADVKYTNQTVAKLTAELGGDVFRAEEELQRRRRLIGEADKVILSHLSESDLEQMAVEWPFKLLFKFEGDPLHDTFQKRIGGYIASVVRQRQFLAELGKKGITLANIFSIQVPDLRLMVDVCASGELLVMDKLTAIKRIFKELQGDAAEIHNLTDSPHKGHLAIKQPWILGDHQLIHMYRSRSVLDEKVHPLVIMDLLGFPEPILPDGKSIAEAIEEAKENIIHKYTSFLPENRGVRVPLRPLELHRGGYRSVTLEKCGNETIARINILGIDYPVRLDSSYDLDFENKIQPKPENVKSIHYVVLSAWQSIVCEDEEDGDNGNGNGNGNGKGRKKLLGRIGYLRKVPNGSYTAYAEDNYWMEQGAKIGLQLADEQERMQELRHTDRPFTYVKKEEDLRGRQGTGFIKAPGIDIPGYQ
ncbi:hypothetical protein HY385_00260 [Candidatus Daviesbacteria bacterium]|nr:hypothetical protein [Candidatus Daviesbacteria bacterium]